MNILTGSAEEKVPSPQVNDLSGNITSNVLNPETKNSESESSGGSDLDSSSSDSSFESFKNKVDKAPVTSKIDDGSDDEKSKSESERVEGFKPNDSPLSVSSSDSDSFTEKIAASSLSVSKEEYFKGNNSPLKSTGNEFEPEDSEIKRRQTVLPKRVGGQIRMILLRH